jgi:hypothetical protein
MVYPNNAQFVAPLAYKLQTVKEVTAAFSHDVTVRLECMPIDDVLRSLTQQSTV